MGIGHHAALEHFSLRGLCPGGTGKSERQVKKNRMRIRKRNNADGSDDKIRIASK